MQAAGWLIALLTLKGGGLGRKSAGLLLYRRETDTLLVLLVHPGGPFWRNKDEGAWSVPKGECAPGEDAEATARREFAEELGPVPSGRLLPLGSVRQRGGKEVEVFALEADFDESRFQSGTFELEWPPRSGRTQSFPEIDRAAWFELEAARTKILSGQKALLDRLAALAQTSGGAGE